MTSFGGSLGTLIDLLTVVLGFSLIIVIHELGHFLAARWAGVRVLAFAVGFGPALVSFRKGLGFRAGSSAPELGKLERAWREGRGTQNPAQISPTEYRLNVLPFGGYVKMLGQDDADPSARSDEPDSYQNVPVWKRMIIISAGVVMNILLAASLFIVVFMVGLRTEPAKVGGVNPGSPAAMTVAENAAALGVTEPGLRAGDRILSINGDQQNTFNDVVLATAMAREGRPMDVLVERPAVGQLRFKILPERGPENLLMIGVLPAISPSIVDARRPDERDFIAQRLRALDLDALSPGMTLASVSVGGSAVKVTSYEDLRAAARVSRGESISAAFIAPGADADGITIDLVPVPEMNTARLKVGAGTLRSTDHLLGLSGVMSVRELTTDGEGKGLRPGDVFARLGPLAWPSYAEGIDEIRARAGKTVPITVARRESSESSTWTLVDLGDIAVTKEGAIGFLIAPLAQSEARIAAWPSFPLHTDPDSAPPAGAAWSASSLPILPGSRIVSVAGKPVFTFADVRTALAGAFSASPDADSHDIRLEVELPLAGATDNGPRPTETVAWAVPRAEADRLLALSWTPPIDESLFQPEQFTDRAAGPAEAIRKGVRETHRVMMSTYITFARLIQGSVKIEHLKGPVGIAHTGTLIASKGFVWLLFFMALISVNLAVINFLPIPIADGGHFLFLLYEQITGRQPSVGVQNAAAVVGLVILGGLFIIVTINDIANLF